MPRVFHHGHDQPIWYLAASRKSFFLTFLWLPALPIKSLRSTTFAPRWAFHLDLTASFIRLKGKSKSLLWDLCALLVMYIDHDNRVYAFFQSSLIMVSEFLLSTPSPLSRPPPFFSSPYLFSRLLFRIPYPIFFILSPSSHPAIIFLVPLLLFPTQCLKWLHKNLELTDKKQGSFFLSHPFPFFHLKSKSFLSVLFSPLILPLFLFQSSPPASLHDFHPLFSSSFSLFPLSLPLLPTGFTGRHLDTLHSEVCLPHNYVRP